MAWKYNDRIIKEGTAWSDKDGTQHPANWSVWSDAEKKIEVLLLLKTRIQILIIVFIFQKVLKEVWMMYWSQTKMAIRLFQKLQENKWCILA